MQDVILDPSRCLLRPGRYALDPGAQAPALWLNSGQ